MRPAYKAVPATKIKNAFGNYLNEVLRTGKPIQIERHGKPVALLVSAEAWEEATGEKTPYRSAWVEMARELSEKIRRTCRPQTPAVELIRQIRDENA